METATPTERGMKKESEPGGSREKSNRERDSERPSRRDSSTQNSVTRTEEATTTDGATNGTHVETVDRGVGPTPLPPTITDHRVPPYFGPLPPPFPDPRNGLIDAAHIGYPFHYAHMPYPINQPLPVNAHTNEGRYQWPPPHLGYHHPSHGVAPSPTHSEVSLISLHGRHTGESLANFASRIQWEHYRRMYSSPISMRGYSPASLPGVPPGSILPHPPLGGASAAPSQPSLFSDIPPTPGSGSITLPGSLESSRLTSPRPSVVGGKGGRKRALSHSPFSECYLDIESLTRSSEGSLQLTPFAHNSRSSSAASGSYGHLSAASLGTISPAHMGTPTHHFLRHGSIPGSPYIHPMVHPMLARQHSGGTMLPPTQPMVQPLGATKVESQWGLYDYAYATKSSSHTKIPSTTTKDPSSSVVSSTVDHSEAKKTKKKKVPTATLR